MIDIIYGSAQDIKHMRIRKNVSPASEGIRCRRNVTSLHPPISRQSRPRQSVNIVTQTMCFQYFLDVAATNSQILFLF